MILTAQVTDTAAPANKRMYYLKKKKKEKKTEKAPRANKPSVATLVKKLDKEFSLFIRLRDSREFGYKAFRCISCGQKKPFEEADCGHFIGRTHMSVRFDELDCNAECRACNRFSSDHIIYYQKNLEKKIGKDKLDQLIARGHQTKKWTAWELEILITHYKEENKRMLAEKEK